MIDQTVTNEGGFTGLARLQHGRHRVGFSPRCAIPISRDPYFLSPLRDPYFLSLCLSCPFAFLLVQNGNPRNIQSPADLLKEGVRLGLGDEKAAAVGKQTVKVFALNGLERGAWEKNVVLSTPTVNELGAAIKLKTIDAAVVWSSTAADYADVSTVVPFEAARNIVSDVKGSVLSFAQEPEVAQAFLDFLSSTNVAPVFVKYGYVLRGPEKAVQ